MSRRGQAMAHAQARPNYRPLMLAAAALAAALMLTPMMAKAAGDYGGGSSSSGGSGYTVDAISKDMRKAQTLINKEDYAGARNF